MESSSWTSTFGERQKFAESFCGTKTLQNLKTEGFLNVEEICASRFLILSFHLAFWPNKVLGRKFEPKNSFQNFEILHGRNLFFFSILAFDQSESEIFMLSSLYFVGFLPPSTRNNSEPLWSS